MRRVKPIPIPEASPRPIEDVRWCQYCGTQRADVFDIDGSWCSPEHRTFDRQSETTWWRDAA